MKKNIGYVFIVMIILLLAVIFSCQTTSGAEEEAIDNMLGNADFSKETGFPPGKDKAWGHGAFETKGSWIFGCSPSGSGEATAAMSGKQINATVTNAGTADWAVQLIQSPVLIQKGNTYNVKFKGKTDAQGVKDKLQLGIKVGGNSSRGWTNYIKEGVYYLALSTEWKTGEFSFTMGDATDEAARFEVWFVGKGNFMLTSPALWVAEAADASKAKGPTQEIISINQVGYYPASPKYVIVENTEKFDELSAFTITSLKDNKTVFEGTLEKAPDWEGDSLALKTGDFSSVTEPGQYALSVKGMDKSLEFTISANVYDKAAKESLRTYFYQRASMAIDEKYAGKWAREAGHPDTECVLHETTGKTGTVSSPYGWYDAGDFGKYMVNGGITVATLLELYELYPKAFDDDLNIPESGNGKSDLLDEVKYELDWFKTMQDPDDSGVFFKVAGLKWPGMVLPRLDTQQRYVIGKSTSATLNFAAVMAQAGRVYAKYDGKFAKDAVNRAEKAWVWAVNNPKAINPKGLSGSGEYMDTNFKDEFFWAAAELFITTGKPVYKEYLTGKKAVGDTGFNLGNLLTSPAITKPAYWGGMTNLGYFSLATRPNTLDPEILTKIKDKIVSYADVVVSNINNSPYRIPMSRKDFVWGSNGGLCNYGVILGYAYRLTSDRKYLNALLETADYLFGKNAIGMSFVTGFGTKSPMRIHHRASTGDGVKDVFPGFVVGGPNNGKQDKQYYPIDKPEKCYVDVVDSYASNEVAINWNAPFVFVLGVIVDNME
ncbi:MAG: glycoside hydrolase family 9 protein [Spirochaetales bacterium]|nr:glycoside hydrolase family 9 protein [Spirochaetales bacterium]